MSSFAVMWSPLLFGFALFLSSALLFLVQPMLGRTLLPHLGGNPIAWNACLVFFQTTLLAGYLYADLIHRFRGLRWQPWLQLLLMAIATTLCFVGVFGDGLLLELAPRLESLESWPIVSTLCLLVVVIGLPFFALAAVSPLVQRWFAHLDHPKSSDPYFLFVASNLGGLTALVIYPLLIEPFSPLYAQWMSWKLAVAALGVLLFLTALCAWQSPRSPEMEPTEKPSDPNAPLVPHLIGRGPATWGRRCYWFFASAIPVGLLMGTTDFLTVDVAPAAILWTVPLALYLIAFSQAFARFSPLEQSSFYLKLSIHVGIGFIAALVAIILTIALLSADQPRFQNGVAVMDGESVGVVVAAGLFFVMLLLVPFSWVWVLQPISALAVVFLQANITRRSGMNPGMILLYLSCFYLSVRLCLGMLALDRPAAPALLTYFNWIGLGGLCGGLFQLLLAPLLFRRDYLEYSLFAALACTLRAAWFPHGLTDWLLCMTLFPKNKDETQPTSTLPGWIAFVFDIGFALVVTVFTAVVLMMRSARFLVSDFPLVLALAAAIFLFARPKRFGLALTAVVALCWIGQDSQRTDETQVVQRRTSFGIMRVAEKRQEFRLRGGDWGNPVPPRYTERYLMHASTHHGSCIIEPPEMLRYPTTYYHRKGPVGQVMRNLEWFPEPAQNLRQNGADFWLQRNRDNTKDDARIAAALVGMMTAPLGTSPLPLEPIVTAWSEPPFACVGLGVGSLLTYAHPYQWVDSYELDPAIIALSTDVAPDQKTPVFHYVQSAEKRGVNAKIIAGDARRSLSKSGREGFYHVIFVDAFNSDAVPVHLLTKEAIEIYFQKLVPDGAVCFHTSNRYVDLASVLENIARDLKLANVTLRAQPAMGNDEPGYFASEWVVLARTPEALRKWTASEAFDRRDDPNMPRPQPPRVSAKLIWTDEHASLLSAVRPGLGWPSMIYGILILILFFGVFLGLVEMTYATMSRSAVKSAPEAPPRQ
jgi:hypothetical protein